MKSPTPFLDRLNADSPTEFAGLESPAEALEIVSTISAELRGLLEERLSDLSLTNEHHDKARQAAALWHPDIDFTISHEFEMKPEKYTGMMLMVKAVLLFTLRIEQNTAQLTEAVDSALNAAVSATSVPYLREGQTVKGLIRRLQNQIDYTDTTESGLELSQSAIRTLDSYFGMRPITVDRLGAPYGNTDFFEIVSSQAIDTPITTIPAIIRKEDNDAESAEFKGTLVIPALNPGHNADNQSPQNTVI